MSVMCPPDAIPASFADKALFEPIAAWLGRFAAPGVPFHAELDALLAEAAPAACSGSGARIRFVPPTGDPPTPLYYCGYGSEASPGGPPADKCAAGAQCGTIPNDQNKNLLGKICVTVPNAPTDILPDTRVTGFYGACK